MELPCEYNLNEEDEDRQHRPPRLVRSSRGLEVLEMTSVPVCIGSGSGGMRSSSSRSSSRDRGDERRPPSDECVWEWCFRRMRTLRELCISKMDTGTVLDLIAQPSAPSTPTTSSEVGISVAEDAVLPRLEKVKIGHCTTFVGPAARLRNANPEGALLKFRVRRPEVEVEWNVVDNLRIRSRQTSAARPAFLELLSP
ncbi:hypothetical protein NLJ89_g10322 [Agrocybe chaxingu]|uniref:Uncharacterized protein n=1 Tax=Agrocybe chaxingu TaxID=84603 RepID=A0A9W8JUE8_9AGAR|nr:hypothetical protein NLJ89_g10322 [Agrocybe chaxingu]